ncbi:MAG: Cobyrinate a,c-diamide synthase [Candidatus Argoarchaeum ethanivorans]|uniref:Cobyrinate a,c-diamide synthase n=1 Tax=Candidatus Argoarchaeum ethanivorans TaxID=2608793 RepID=A0A811TFP8_9EURY|nr:MAG: Cobyrinate a,c-diamide synthase [Candidatus Argoarchaeum ethanivorans]
MIPGIIIAGTSSGSGKTTIATGIMAALSQDHTVQAFKVGPDFIDPTHHTAITNRASRNLDTYMMGEHGVIVSFNRAASDADIAVVEGVMGLFDGLEGELASTAHVAKTLHLPVILVVDAKGLGQSAAAVINGYASFDPQLSLSGIILNRVGSQRHTNIIVEALRKAHIKIPVIGAVPKNPQIHTPSRHLGLHMAYETVTSSDASKLAGIIREHVDLKQLLEIAKTADMREVAVEKEDAASLVRDVTIGIAFDESFCFYYQDTFDHLRRYAQLEFFSPMKEELPDVDGLYLGGGYPELYAEALSKSGAREQIKKAACDGMPIYGECGALLYLGKTLEVNHNTYSMCGVFDVRSRMTGRLQALGYTNAHTINDNILTKKGATLLGHEFHYSTTSCEHDQRFAYEMKRGKGVSNGFDGLIYERTLTSYTHIHPSNTPFDGFIEQCKKYKRE